MVNSSTSPFLMASGTVTRNLGWKGTADKLGDDPAELRSTSSSTTLLSPTASSCKVSIIQMKAKVQKQNITFETHYTDVNRYC